MYAAWKLKRFSLTLASDPAAGGTTTGAGTYDYGTNATINAVPNAGYKFLKWNDENTNASREIAMTEDKSYVAIFQ